MTGCIVVEQIQDKIEQGFRQVLANNNAGHSDIVDDSD